MYQPIGIKNPPLKPDFVQILEICSYCLKFSLKSKFKFLLFSRKYRQKKIACGAKFTRLYLCIPSKFRFPIQKHHFFRLRRKVSSVCSQNPPNPSKNFRLRRKMDNFLSLRSYFLKIFKFKFLLFEIFFQFLKSKFLTRGGFLIPTQWYAQNHT